MFFLLLWPKLTLENQYGSGKKSQKSDSKNEARLKINICKDKHSLEIGFLGPLLELQHWMYVIKSPA